MASSVGLPFSNDSEQYMSLVLETDRENLAYLFLLCRLSEASLVGLPFSTDLEQYMSLVLETDREHFAYLFLLCRLSVASSVGLRLSTDSLSKVYAFILGQ